MNKREARLYAIEMLKKVGIPRAEAIYDSYPHSLSGGMRQRVMIAMALSCNPKLLIADEPTTALDVTIQAQILDILKNLMEEIQTSLILITHNLGLVVELAQKTAVMYAGHIVEFGSVEDIFENPKHPYTIGLLASVPRLDSERKESLRIIKGLPPNLARLPGGCSFHPRCDYAFDRCREEMPEIEEVGPDHFRACFYDADKLRK